MSHRLQSLSACRAQRDCAHLETGLFSQISLWCLSFQHHNPVVILSHSAHRCGVGVWVSLTPFLADTVHFAIALPATLALGLSFARSLAVGRPSIGCSLAVPAIPRVVSRLAAHVASLANFVVA